MYMYSICTSQLLHHPRPIQANKAYSRVFQVEVELYVPNYWSVGLWNLDPVECA